MILLSLLIFLFAKLAISWHKKRLVQRWLKHLSLKEHEKNYSQLFKNVDGFALSKQARSVQDAFEYTYGEIEFTSFIALLSSVQPKADTVFYDLGSGTGTAVLACAMVFKPLKSCGIELFKTLHEAALAQQQQLAELPIYREQAKNIQLIQGDFLDIDFKDANIIFINATALIGETWTTLTKRLEQLKTDTIVITTTKQLKTPIFTLIKTSPVQMSWGVVHAFVYKIKNN